jgi:hypothetical protein
MIIGISGKARSGKDTFAEFFGKALSKQTGYIYVMMAYAHELKCMAQKEFDLSWDQLWGDEKETPDERYMKTPEPHSQHYTYWTGREIMQAFGEFYRSIEYNFWVRKLFSAAEEKEYENVIITDCRYPNEIDPIKERDGYHIRVNRNTDNNVHGKDHASETSLDDGYKVDFDIDNNGTIEDLKKAAEDTASAIINMEKLRRNS